MKKTNTVLFILIIFLCLSLPGGCHKNENEPEKFENTQESVENARNAEQSPADPSTGAAPSEQTENAGETAAPQESKTPSQDEFAKLAPTTVMSFEELVGDNGDYAKVQSYPPAGTYEIVVNLRYQVITAYKKDADGKYTVPARYMICSTGSGKDPSPSGTFKMGSQRHRFSKFEKFNVYGQYWSQITRNIFFHSVLYTAKDAKTYTASSYKNLGKRVSHGCIRMLVPDARWIYYYAAPGTVVKIIGGKKDAAMEEIKKKLTRAKLPSKRPNLQKGKIPVTEPWPGYTGSITRK